MPPVLHMITSSPRDRAFRSIALPSAPKNGLLMSGSTSPRVRLEPIRSVRAARLGRYPSWAMALRTRSAVSGATVRGPLFSV